MRPRKPKTTARHSVTVQPGGRTGRARRWAYGYTDLATLLGSTEASMRTKVYNGWEPTLENVCMEWLRRADKSSD